MGDVEVDFSGLNEIIKQWGGTPPHVDVGILGSGASEQHEGTTDNNATIGAIHEFGSISRDIPERSFIKMPLTKKADVLAETMKNHFDMKDPVSTMKKVGIAAEGIIHEAFDSQGFGTWEPLSPNYKIRPSGQPVTADSQPLRDTGELERAVTSEVSNGA